MYFKEKYKFNLQRTQLILEKQLLTKLIQKQMLHIPGWYDILCVSSKLLICGRWSTAGNTPKNKCSYGNGVSVCVLTERVHLWELISWTT